MSKKNKITLLQIEEAYRAKGALVLKRCRMILRDEAEAQDAFHESFKRLLKYKVEVETEQISLSFLYRIAERCCFDALKRRKMAIHISDEARIGQSLVHNDLGRNEAFDILNKFFLNLSIKLQHVALLYFVDGLTQEQIARELGWSRKTIGKKINLLRKLADNIKKE